MQFEFDQTKSESNLDKHGIDFEDIQELWFSQMLVYHTRTKGERRNIGIGRMGGQYRTVIFVQEKDSIGIISARRSTMHERGQYDRYISSQRNNK